jgi:polysaccharide biosynthesis protein PslG
MQFIKINKAGVLAALALFCTILTVTAFALTRTEEDPFRGDAIIDPPFTPLTYSVQAFMWWNNVGLHTDWARLIGFSHLKQTFAWEDIEINPDEWHFEETDIIVQEVNNRGLHLVVRLSDAPDWAHPSLSQRKESDYVDAPADNLDDWGEYCGVIAERYAGRIAAYQIWNEPNLTREWGGRPPDASGYVEVLRVCSEAIRQYDPEAILISAGLSPTGTHNDTAHRDDIYLQAMYDAGFQQYIDVVGVHAPGHSEPEYGPDDAERDGAGRWQTFRRVEDLRKIMIANDDEARQMAILEVGYTTDPRESIYTWFAVDEATQAKNLEAAYLYAAENWRPWVGLMSAIYFAKPTWTQDDEQFWWAFNDPQSNTMRPVFGAMSQMVKYCGDIIVPKRTGAGSAFAPAFNPCR